eukprot:CAMPEP_0115014820 /NCGR_PEP_ID=MMETSP0216-20121206/26336_1 /TAXON_ID=223996 /ORGANISM="Protocruzia adherens, Strain Boccale" /LENGTH=32 /DNA_ID= /DNA_START= /DNA_END= /DNA_ORIENTATION=
MVLDEGTYEGIPLIDPMEAAARSILAALYGDQ